MFVQLHVCRLQTSVRRQRPSAAALSAQRRHCTVVVTRRDNVIPATIVLLLLQHYLQIVVEKSLVTSVVLDGRHLNLTTSSHQHGKFTRSRDLDLLESRDVIGQRQAPSQQHWKSRAGGLQLESFVVPVNQLGAHQLYTVNARPLTGFVYGFSNRSILLTIVVINVHKNRLYKNVRRRFRTYFCLYENTF